MGRERHCRYVVNVRKLETMNCTLTVVPVSFLFVSIRNFVFEIKRGRERGKAKIQTNRERKNTMEPESQKARERERA